MIVRERSWERSGIAPNSRFLSLLYNAPADTLVASFERKLEDGHPISEIYTRDRSSSTYHRVTGGSDLLSFCQPVSAHSVPLLYFNVRQHPSDDPHFSNWECIRRLDLRTGEIATVVSPVTMDSPFGRVWVSELLSVDPAGERLTCKMGFMRDTSETSAHVDYWLCDLPVSDSLPRRICELSEVFF